MKEFLGSQEFYDLMQAYRIAPITDQERVVKCFEDVKTAINDSLSGSALVKQNEAFASGLVAVTLKYLEDIALILQTSPAISDTIWMDEDNAMEVIKWVLKNVFAKKTKKYSKEDI